MNKRTKIYNYVKRKNVAIATTFIGCPEGYFFFQVGEKGRTGFYKGQSEPCMGDSVV